MKTGIELIAEERQRQIEKEGYTPEHDDSHSDGELAMAAVCYAATERVYIKRENDDNEMCETIFYDPWPFLPDPRSRGFFDWDKRKAFADGNYPLSPDKYSPEQRMELLIKSGALIAAEIDRLNRLNKELPVTQPHT